MFDEVLSGTDMDQIASLEMHTQTLLQGGTISSLFVKHICRKYFEAETTPSRGDRGRSSHPDVALMSSPPGEGKTTSLGPIDYLARAGDDEVTK